jgi:hypothetical protein
MNDEPELRREMSVLKFAILDKNRLDTAFDEGVPRESGHE